MALNAILDRLADLVACDTRNPPRAIAPDHPIIPRLKSWLPDFKIDLVDLGEGCLQIWAQRGQPDTLINIHLDTVPDVGGWSHAPLNLTRGADRAIGLGACDIKGAAAAALAAATATEGPAAFLFTTDEEHGGSTCVQKALIRAADFKQIMVAEPTGAKAVVAHRGCASYEARFDGVARHGSDRQCLTDNAIHRATRWLALALELSAICENEPSELPGIRLNAGRIEGGIKANISAASCTLRLGARPGPARTVAGLRDELASLGPKGLPSDISTVFDGPPLAPTLAARNFARRIGLEEANAVDFWTEASLFACAGIPALVFGPGDIAQAHTADEWVAYDDLEAAFQVYARVMSIHV